MAKKRIEQLYEEFAGFVNTLSEDERGWEVPKNKKDQYHALKKQGKSTGEAIAIIRSQMDEEEELSEIDGRFRSPKPKRRKEAKQSPIVKLSSVRNLDIYLFEPDSNDAIIIASVSRSKKRQEKALTIYGEHIGKTNTFSIGDTNADPKYIGSGIGFVVYKEVIMSGITLMSGDAQTKGSQTIWKKLIEDPDVFVYAFDAEERIKDPTEVDIHNGKVMAGDTNVYEDLDLVLVAKKK